MVRIASHHAAGVPPPRRATRRIAASAKVMIGRVEASAMMTTTNSGFGVVDRVVEVVLGRLPAACRTSARRAARSPRARRRLRPRRGSAAASATHARRRRPPGRARARSSCAMLDAVRQAGEPRRRERVQNREAGRWPWRRALNGSTAMSIAPAFRKCCPAAADRRKAARGKTSSPRAEADTAITIIVTAKPLVCNRSSEISAM